MIPSLLYSPISKLAIDRVKCSLGKRLHVYMKKKKNTLSISLLISTLL